MITKMMKYLCEAMGLLAALAISTVIYSAPALQMRGNGWFDYVAGLSIFTSIGAVIYHAYLAPIETVSPEWLASTLGDLRDELRQLQKAVDRLER